MKTKYLKNNNSGMTLVELLVAVAIFSAAIVPMLFAFVYSTGFSFRAQQTMQSTGISQAIIERAKAPGLSPENIRDGLADGTLITNYNLADTTNQPFSLNSVGGSAPAYWAYGVRATNTAGEEVDAGVAARRSYDVQTVFKPIQGVPTDSTDEDESRYDYSSIQSMSSDTTANFCDAYTENLKTTDEAALGELLDIIENEIIVDGNVTGTGYPGTLPAGVAGNFSKSDVLVERLVIDRRITIVAEDTGVKVRIEYFCDGYDTDFNPSTHEDIALSSKSVTIDSHNVTLSLSGDFTNDYSLSSGSCFYFADIGGTPADAEHYFPIQTDKVTSIYFYFYPGFRSRGTGLPGYRDYFVLDNDMTSSGLDAKGNETKRLNFYLFKQYNSSWDSATHAYDTLDRQYAPDVTMEDAAFATYLYDNFLIQASDGKTLKSYSDSFANSVSSHVHLGDKCYNSTNYVTLSGSFAYNLRGTAAGAGTVECQSLLLADQAVLPYRHEEGMEDTYRKNMYVTRNSISVEVYKPGETTNPIERIDGEVLSW